ncbi:hypothetical protein [Tateyamaria sp. SN6-1]|uniref:hypothetical protein n=1 Tax=Tateyamaria sp. SN6-1 TaxID=3092148 RepID=UPI0039F45BEC
MNMNQIINMVMRIIMRKAISKGIDAGVSRATRGRKQQPQQRKLADIPPEEMTPKQRVRAERRARRAAQENGDV